MRYRTGGTVRVIALGAVVVVTLSACGGAAARHPENGIYPYPPGAGPDAPRGVTQTTPWPELIVDGDDSVAINAPRVESWTADRLTARAAVEIDRPAQGKTYGLVWIESKTTTDATGRRISLDDVRFVRADFPSARADESAWVSFLQDRRALEGKELSIAQVHADLALARRPATLPLKTAPPRIVFTERPEVLVQVDGAPVLRAEDSARRVINTRALMLLDDGVYWLWVGDRWFRSRSADGEYAEAASDAIPTVVEGARIRLQEAGAFDPFTEATSKIGSGASVFVATTPTELVETRGAPTYSPIAGTTLSWVTNTSADVFHDAGTNAIFVLLAGRWFRAPQLSGPWVYVAPGELPPTFASIPPTHPKADVRASIAGTPEAEEAVIASEFTTMAAIDRAHVQLSVAYDGPPELAPIAGASEPLRYAVNTATPVIEDNGMYYALENGVWFAGTSATGPWVVANEVPDAVYTIPVSSPLYYVTYVRVYDWFPDFVYVGYTPGYYGAIADRGVVVWGTGYSYRPWLGRVWYGGPATWGFGVGFGFGAGVGFAYGGWGHPWWGPARWGGFEHGAPRGTFGRHATAYDHWGSVARSPSFAARRESMSIRQGAQQHAGALGGQDRRIEPSHQMGHTMGMSGAGGARMPRGGGGPRGGGRR